MAFVGAEGLGLPIPGETVLVAAAIYAGTTHELDIGFVIAASSLGGLIGNLGGFWLGRELGHDLLLRYGHYLHLDESKLKVGQYLFLRHGGKVVFFGRFIAFLRTFAAILAGINEMPLRHFLVAATTSSILWSAIFGLGGYFLGEEVHRFRSTAGIVAGAAVITVAVILYIFLRRNWRRIEAEAEQHFPGHLQPRHHLL